MEKSCMENPGAMASEQWLVLCSGLSCIGVFAHLSPKAAFGCARSHPRHPRAPQRPKTALVADNL
jgi:hypothetical protein